MLRLSVLDQSPIPAGTTPGGALRNTIDLAQHAERLGYHRYWLAEHHNSRALAGSSPEILIGAVADATSSMRVGSGGVMLSHYSALKVVENFRLLHALHPGRIDLGIGRAPGSDQLTAQALQLDHRLPQDDAFPQQLAELMAFLDGTFPAGHPFRRIIPSPVEPGGPEVWLLGSTGYSAAYAAHLGLPFCFAQFINPEGGAEITAFHRDNFEPAVPGVTATGALAVGVVCGRDDDEAEDLAASVRVWRLRLERGDPGQVPTVEDAVAELRNPEIAERVARSRRRLIVGGPLSVRAQLEELTAEYGVDEVIVVTIVHDHEARRESYRLLAGAFAQPALRPAS
ncbi:MAG: LLM class flavin-dependent oxidoreductase [Acidimicrobiales bacterium]